MQRHARTTLPGSVSDGLPFYQGDIKDGHPVQKNGNYFAVLSKSAFMEDSCPFRLQGRLTASQIASSDKDGPIEEDGSLHPRALRLRELQLPAVPRDASNVKEGWPRNGMSGPGSLASKQEKSSFLGTSSNSPSL